MTIQVNLKDHSNLNCSVIIPVPDKRLLTDRTKLESGNDLQGCLPSCCIIDAGSIILRCENTRGKMSNAFGIVKVGKN